MQRGENTHAEARMKTKSPRYGFAVTCVWLLTSLLAAAAHAEPYPNKAVKIIMDAAAGSAPDVALRVVVGDRLGQIWGQQVLPVNQPGAGGSLAARAAAEAAPDGSTLYNPVSSTFLQPSGVAPNLPIELPRDFVGIGMVAEIPMFVAAAPSSGISTLPELIARAKERPGELSYAVTGVGRLTHLTGELLQLRAGVRFLMVPYTGGPAHAIGDVIAGRVAFIIEGYSGIAGAIQSGSVKALAVASQQRLPDFPDVPTVAETLPGFTAGGWQVLVAPRGTPDAIIAKAGADLRQVVTDPDILKKLAVRGTFARPMSPAETTAFTQDEQRKWKPVLERIYDQPR
jgi:tripartite-type tricarboxylate transporter receptor subunit TctC